MLVELFVIFVLELSTVAGPQRLRMIDCFKFRALLLAFIILGSRLFHANRKRDVIRITAHQGTYPVITGELLLGFFEVQHNAGTTLRQQHTLYIEVTLSTRFPVHAFFGSCACLAGEYFHLIRNDEG